MGKNFFSFQKGGRDGGAVDAVERKDGRWDRYIGPFFAALVNSLAYRFMQFCHSCIIAYSYAFLS